jgi:NAD(P) transhydrogenase
VIATGTTPARPNSVEFDGKKVIDSDGILQPDELPRSLVVVGAGVIGIEYASMFAAVGCKVTVVEQRDRCWTSATWRSSSRSSSTSATCR